jgi:antibiotic biosynthesis monooxygenase (ABM) superfamily enzyme
MYGTIARMRVKPGKEAELAQIGRESAQGIPGLVFEHIFKMDAGPNEYMLVVAFTDKASYRANAESPEQNERYQQYVALLDGEPEWHDGEIVDSYPG